MPQRERVGPTGIDQLVPPLASYLLGEGFDIGTLPLLLQQNGQRVIGLWKRPALQEANRDKRVADLFLTRSFLIDDLGVFVCLSAEIPTKLSRRYMSILPRNNGQQRPWHNQPPQN